MIYSQHSKYAGCRKVFGYMSLPRAAIIPAKGLGDALMMMIASHQLCRSGYATVTFEPRLSQMQRWFPDHVFHALDKYPQWDELLSPFDLVIAQNDNSERIEKIKQLEKKGLIKKLCLFYPTYEKTKHGTLSAQDRIFICQNPMVENIAQSINSLLGIQGFSKDNGLVIPKELKHRKFLWRVLIHPTSTNRQKNWPAEKFLQMATRLQQAGYEPIFALEPHDYPQWQSLLEDKFSYPRFHTLDELACYIYESGYVIGNDSFLGHLASNLHIPQMIIAGEAKRMRLWRPGWLQGELVTAPSWVPNIKFCRLRDNHWHKFISAELAFQTFIKLTKTI